MSLPVLSECPSNVVNVLRHVVRRLWHEINSHQTNRTENTCQSIHELDDAGSGKIVDHLDGVFCIQNRY